MLLVICHSTKLLTTLEGVSLTLTGWLKGKLIKLGGGILVNLSMTLTSDSDNCINWMYFYGLGRIQDQFLDLEDKSL